MFIAQKSIKKRTKYEKKNQYIIKLLFVKLWNKMFYFYLDLLKNTNMNFSFIYSTYICSKLKSNNHLQMQNTFY